MDGTTGQGNGRRHPDPPSNGHSALMASLIHPRATKPHTTPRRRRAGKFPLIPLSSRPEPEKLFQFSMENHRFVLPEHLKVDSNGEKQDLPTK